MEASRRVAERFEDAKARSGARQRLPVRLWKGLHRSTWRAVLHQRGVGTSATANSGCLRINISCMVLSLPSRYKRYKWLPEVREAVRRLEN